MAESRVVIQHRAYIRAFWYDKQERSLRYTPQQLYCTGCTERTFYLMAQNDGSIEAFCVKNNHKRVLVNIPELVEYILNGTDAESSASKSDGPREITGEEKAQIQAGEATNDTVVVDVSHTNVVDPG